MERRDFFSELFSEAAKKLNLGKIFDFSFSWNAQDLLTRAQSDADFWADVVARAVIRTGEAVALSGEAFGSFVQDIRLQEFLSPLGEPSKDVLVIICEHRDSGRSIFEWMDGKHIVSSHHNQRLDVESVAALDGAGYKISSKEKERADGTARDCTVLVRVSESGNYAVIGVMGADGTSFVSVLANPSITA